MSEKEYIERGVLVSILYAKSDMAMGTPKAVFASVSKMVELLPAADVVSRGVFEQVKWELDMAMQQLEEHGIPFGGEADDVVNVVRCKDCKYFKHFKGCGNWCHRRIRTDIEFHTKTNDFCSWGKRKDKDDGR